MKSDRKIAASLPPAPPPPLGANSAFSQGRSMNGRTSGPTRRSTRGQWTPEEDETLCKAVQRYNGKNWKKIAECFKDRTDVQCLHRWQKVLNPELIKGPWSKEEDEIIIQLVDKYGPKKWSTISQHLPGRIGKQCRERWHNHLNPSINKEAWTQEEEIILIRAHQIHGNRWAELTKYLTGRTDNAIKNHWNSSVKKKLDSYIASGVLAQFQGLPLVSHQSHQSMASPSFQANNSSAAGSDCKDGTATEDNSECSQVGCSQTASDMSNTACQTRDDFVLSEESDYGKVQSGSPTASCSIQYSASLDDITFTITDMPYDFSCPSNYLEESLSKDSGMFTARDCNFGAIGLSNICPIELAAESCDISGDHFIADHKHELVHTYSHQSTTECNVPASVDDVVMASDVPGQKKKPEERGSRIRLPVKGGESSSMSLTKCSNIIDIDRYRELLTYQSRFQLSEIDGSVSLQPCNPLNATEGEASHCQNLSEVAAGNDLILSTKELSQLESLTLSQLQEGVTNAGGLIHAQNCSALTCNDHIDVGIKQTDALEPSRLVPVNTFGSETSGGQQIHPFATQQSMEYRSEQEVRTLCYEPPRFPSLDGPFFSCDLAHSGTDTLQEYSPLGIRQLIMPFMDSLTPLKLWDSPSSDDGPDAVLKSAAKSFARTPTILKKRHRDLLSPLSPFSERRHDKKIGSDANQGILCTSRLTKELSCLDVMHDEIDHCMESIPHDQNNTMPIEDRENICPRYQARTRETKYYHDSRDTFEGEWNSNNIVDLDEEGILDLDTMITIHENHVSGMPRGILVEHPLNGAQFSTPEGVGPKAGQKSSEKPSGVDQSSENTSRKEAISESGTMAGSLVSPCSFVQRKQGNDNAISTEIIAENPNIFSGTPFRRSIESPSAWKSPWYFSSLVHCPRFDSDITIEDIGIFSSPGIGSMDAIGLMKQINEQSADAYADAREVLGSETPESILRQRFLKSQNPERESKSAVESQHEGRLRLASNVLTERRILDFSECGTPEEEEEKCVNAAGLSSPSSCLLKNYR